MNISKTVVICFMLCLVTLIVGVASFELGYHKVAVIMPVAGCLLFLRGLFALEEKPSIFID